jgi:hypothetical protein
MTNSFECKSACLDAAKAAVCGDRALNYGTPEDNFRRIATLWNAWLQVRKDSSAPLAPWEVAIMMDLMKSARLANTPEHQDSWIDKAGYAACGADITQASAERDDGVCTMFNEQTRLDTPIVVRKAGWQGWMMDGSMDPSWRGKTDLNYGGSL